MKIAIIGFCGFGKSTLAKFLSDELHLPLLYLDTVQFVENRQLRGREETYEKVLEFMKLDAWVMDGNYDEFYLEQRCRDADEIIFLNFDRWLCFIRAWKRYWIHKGKSRESMMCGCNEKFDFEFIWWLLYLGRKQKDRLQSIVSTYPQKSHIIRNQKQQDSYKIKRSRT